MRGEWRCIQMATQFGLAVVFRPMPAYKSEFPALPVLTYLLYAPLRFSQTLPFGTA
jgi:hypothetical protein